MQRAKWVILDSLTAIALGMQAPEKQICEVKILASDGRTLVGHCEVMKGEPGNPYRAHQVQRKFMKLATQAWNADVAY